jgi:hypothetical protein
MKVTVEFTAPYTPQQNGVAERGIVVVGHMARAMLKEANIEEDLKQLLWSEAVSTATDIANIIVPSTREKSPQELFVGVKSTVYNFLQPFGRICYVADRNKIKAKSANRSFKCLYLGPAKNHSNNVYRFYKVDTGKVIFSKDVNWADWHGGRNPADGIPGLHGTNERVGIDFDEVDIDDDTEFSSLDLMSAADSGRRIVPPVNTTIPPPVYLQLF